MHAQVLVFDHHAPGLLERRRDEQWLRRFERRRAQPGTQLLLVTCAADGEAIDRTDVDAGITLDAQLGLEYGLHITVEAALCFLSRLLDIEAELDLDVDLLEAFLQRHMRHQTTLERRVVVLIGPLVHAHLAARELDAGRRALLDRLAVAKLVDRDGGLMAVLDRPDDVLRALGGITAEEHAGPRRLESHGIDRRHIPLVERDTDVAFDPGEGILLPDRQDDIVARDDHLADRLFALDPAALELVFHALEAHAGEPTVLDHEGLGGVIHHDLDPLLLGILELPGGGLEKAARLARHHLDALGAEPQRAAAAVHGGISDADDEYALADRIDVAESDRLEPGDANVDAVGLVPTGQLELLAFGCPRAYEHCVVAAALEQLAHASNRVAEPQLDTHVDDHADLLVEHSLRQAKRRDIAAHQPAGHLVLLEDRNLVTERCQVIGDRERGGAGADAGDTLAVGLCRRLRQRSVQLALEIRGYPLEAANRHRLVFDALASTGGLAGAIADAAEDAGKYVRGSIEEVGVVIAALRNQADVFWDVRMR